MNQYTTVKHVRYDGSQWYFTKQCSGETEFQEVMSDNSRLRITFRPGGRVLHVCRIDQQGLQHGEELGYIHLNSSSGYSKRRKFFNNGTDISSSVYEIVNNLHNITSEERTLIKLKWNIDFLPNDLDDIIDDFKIYAL